MSFFQAQFSGALLGGLVFGVLSDRIGRILPIQICSVICLVFGIVGAFSPNYFFLLIDRFIVGFAVAGFPQMCARISGDIIHLYLRF